MESNDHDLLLQELEMLESEHKDLNETSLEDLDQLTLQRIKKRKLFIKDRISNIRTFLDPDLLA